MTPLEITSNNSLIIVYLFRYLINFHNYIFYDCFFHKVAERLRVPNSSELLRSQVWHLQWPIMVHKMRRVSS